MEITKFTEFLLKGIDKDGNEITFVSSEDSSIDVSIRQKYREGRQFLVDLVPNSNGITTYIIKDNKLKNQKDVTEEEFLQILKE